MSSSDHPRYHAQADAKDWLLAPGSQFFSRRTQPELMHTVLSLEALDEGSDSVRSRRSVYDHFISSYAYLHPLYGAEYRDLEAKLGNLMPSLAWAKFYAVVDNWPWFFPLEACHHSASKPNLTALDAFIDVALFATSSPSSKSPRRARETQQALRTFFTHEFPVALDLWQRALNRYSTRHRAKTARDVEPWTDDSVRQVRDEVIAQAAGTKQSVVSGTRINSYEATLVDWLARERRALFTPVERHKLVKRGTGKDSLSSTSTSHSYTPRDPLSSVTSLESSWDPEATGETGSVRQKLRNGVVKVFKG